ncbi:hypothetical protein LJC49_03390 [Ruminococcaceae bacterium OttesenSCG-928-I18]|nr:hypothetical protein [Ruminococcaceae bacterium OttesenSCG-928-I18]
MSRSDAAAYYTEVIYGKHKTLIASLGELDENASYYCEGTLTYDDAGFFSQAQSAWEDYLRRLPHTDPEPDGFFYDISERFRQYYPSFIVHILPKKKSTKEELHYLIKVKRN